MIGIHCAERAQNTGLARGELVGRRVEITHARRGNPGEVIAYQIIEWLENRRHALIALDAPLGWPISLGRILARHHAGDAIMRSPDQLFRRTTDNVVRDELENRPLDIGVNPIARTSHAALHLLYEIRALSRLPIPLAWTPGYLEGVAAIEVFPGATLASRRKHPSGSVKEQTLDQRSALLAQMLRELGPPPEARKQILLSNHAFDAAVCVLAAADFLTAEVFEPTDLEMARREGWIWARKPVDYMLDRPAQSQRPSGSTAFAPP